MVHQRNKVLSVNEVRVPGCKFGKLRPGLTRPTLLLVSSCQYVLLEASIARKRIRGRYDAGGQMFITKPFRNLIHGASCVWLTSSLSKLIIFERRISTHVLAIGAIHCKVYTSCTRTVFSEPPRVFFGRNADSGFTTPAVANH